MNAAVSLLPRRLVLVLAAVALVLAWSDMAHVARTIPWHRHPEANLPFLTDALALNSGDAPARIGQPGLLGTQLLALDWRIRHDLELLPVWNISTLGKDADPVRKIPSLVRLEQSHSRLLVILLILGGGALACAVVPGIESGCLAVVLLCSGAGLLYHGLVVQPELLGCGLGGVLVLLCVWRGTMAVTWWGHHLGLFLAGLCAGLAALTQAAGVGHLVVAYAWCWLAAFTTPALRPGRLGLRVGILPLAGAVLLLAFAQPAAALGATTAVTAERIRLLALVTGLLPLLALWAEAGRFGAFLSARAGEAALLAGGALAALALAYPALRAVLPAPAALTCWAGQLELLCYPGLVADTWLTAPAGIGREVFLFIRETPLLYLSAATLAFTLVGQREVPARTKAFLALLLVEALGITWVLAHAGYGPAAGVGAQVFLLLLCAIALLAAGPWPHRAGHRPWLAPVVLVAVTVLLVTAPLRLRAMAPPASAEETPTASGHTLTYLFDHHAHPPAYRRMMKGHYGDPATFARALERYLADPAARDGGQP